MSLETETVLATEEHHHLSMNNDWEECVDCGVLTCGMHCSFPSWYLKFYSHCCKYSTCMWFNTASTQLRTMVTI